MFLHLGEDVMVLKKDVIAILDSRTRQAAGTKEFMAGAKEKGFIKKISTKEKEKTLVLTTKEIYLSPISCNTLKKRSLNVLTMGD